MAVDVEDILARVNIVDIIQEYIPLKKQGSNYKGVCPFHSDHDPSLTVSEQKQIFNCFACNTGGNAIRFISLYEQISYSDAIHKLCDRLGIEYNQKTPANEERLRKVKDLKSLNKQVANYFFNNLKKSEIGINYMKARGISPETAMQFGLGYAGDDWSGLFDHFTKSGISPETLVSAGFVTVNSKDGKKNYYDKFRGRLMFPIFDEYGEVIAFGGRIIEKNDKLAKYLNSPDTIAYKKGEHLYGMNIAKKSGSKKLIVVEGYMDCIALHSKGINYAVASLGTALTERQAKLIRQKGFQTVILSYDNDNAGKNATIRGMEILKSAGLEVKIFRIKGAKDADEYLRNHTKTDFEKQLLNSYSLTEYKIILAAEKFPPDSNEHVIGFIKSVKSILSKLDQVEIDIYSNWVLNNYADLYKIKRENILVLPDDKNTGSDLLPVKRVYIQKSISDKKLDEEQKKTDRFEKKFLVLLAENPSLVEKIDGLNEEVFWSEENAQIFRKLVELRKERRLEGIKSLYDGSDLDSVFAGIYMEYNVEPGKETAVAEEYLRKLKNNKIAEEIANISRRLGEENLSIEEKKNLMVKLTELSKIKKG